MSLFNYWAKTPPETGPGPRYHLLPFHNLDVAACGDELLDAIPGLEERLSRVAGIEPARLRSWLRLLLATHDLGKASLRFQSLDPKVAETLLGTTTQKPYSIRHDALGQALWDQRLFEALLDAELLSLDADASNRRRWHRALDPWITAVAGHHGTPPSPRTGTLGTIALSEHFRPDALEAIEDYIPRLAFLVDEQPPLSLGDDLRRTLRESSWLVAGIAVLADWLGSNEQHFEFVPERRDLETYWRQTAQPSASEAVDAAGLREATTRSGQSIRDLFDYVETPTPLQAHAGRLDVPEGPSLHVFEDLTGAGKTEAALLLAYRLLEEGPEDGLYVGLPTMATANSMYDRLRSTYRRLYDTPPRPSLVLAHGRAQLEEDFTEIVSSPAAATTTETPDDGAAVCSRWLADRRKAALVGHVGVGTVDQALLGVLPARYQSLRLAGLSRKVLVIDEVHSYDPYVLELLRTLVRFQLANGSSVILLSATLPQAVRRKLLDTAADALGLSNIEPDSSEYPLATTLTPSGLSEEPIDPREGSPRTYDLSLVSSKRDVLDYLVDCSSDGEAACWVRNTVDDAIDAYLDLRERLPEERVHLFHGRFAFEDRSRIEDDVLERFGKASSVDERAGHILVATQVVEQSLDLDFDAMVSDLAPIDLLLQRAGRLHRHDRDANGNPLEEGPDRRGQPHLVVHGPEPVEEPDEDWFQGFLPGAAYVYPDHGRLWLTARLATQRDAWSLPEDARELMETVYGPDVGARIPVGLETRWIEASGKQKADASTGRFRTLPLSQGYRPDVRAWSDQTDVQTRLAAHTTEIRLARIQDGSIEPWAAAEERPWSHSEVRVPAYTYTDPLFPEGCEHLEETAQEDMPDGGEWTDVLPLVETQEATWTGRVRTENGEKVRVVYDETFGLTEAKEDRR